MQNTQSARLFSASILGSRAGSVAVRVSGCSGAAWVWCNRHRQHPAALALRVPITAPASAASSSARTVAARFGLRVTVRRAPCGAVWLKCQGSHAQQVAAAAWWSRVLRGHAAAVSSNRARAQAHAAAQVCQVQR